MLLQQSRNMRGVRKTSQKRSSPTRYNNLMPQQKATRKSNHAAKTEMKQTETAEELHLKVDLNEDS